MVFGSVSPWEVTGPVDYDRLIEEFGTQRLDENLVKELESLAGESHYMLRRKIYYSHRDLDLVLKDFREGRGFFLYTGRGPSGPMHIGHMIPFHFTQWLQKRFKVNVYIQLTDDEKFLEEKRRLSLEETRRWSYENALDIIAVGFDPDRTFIFQDTEYIRNIYPAVLKVAKKVNLSTARAVFGFSLSTNIGLILFPAIQIVPTFFERKRCLIPAAIDQDPYWRVQRDIAESLGYKKAAAIHSKFIPPLTGFQGKMSSSAPESAIYLSDPPDVVRTKVMKYAFSGGQPTAELHRKLGGNPEIDVPFQWLYMFLEEDDSEVERIREEYRSGRMLTGELKEILIKKVNEYLEIHRQRREEAKELINTFKYDGKLAKEMWERVID
ncbi:MAG: tryptophan--tRNA ligase [Thermoproteota archaeon]|uniref:Tryptophan--tRNA ligase n=1 Tax=Candidatus Methanodesulfokora washburnensis TaxID=2478471 RepID=A0A429GNG3_9CREN|nr:tryptophan--tRNA ligase [Candidatus Methanodesulfokores washburnensis]RSN75263.1 tryptophan--tRNA ligase [Candidatus Methanodesulfokores washburnensis]RZN60057.1 MAG: tryptophan--tRNA ligase [Candidatus Methanodesulfokores washburnensis]TDA39638.1 MAG: tryptophan--tRNA ligase [Candidatus Korarchaeota archaeon]